MVTTGMNAMTTAKTVMEATDRFTEMKKRKNATTAEMVGIGNWKAIQVGGFRPLQAAGECFSGEEKSMIANDFAPLVEALKEHTRAIGSLVATLAPEVPDLVGTDYIARRLGVSKQWVGQMAERGDIPRNCVAPKISGGRIWKFHRDKIEAWLREREEG